MEKKEHQKGMARKALKFKKIHLNERLETINRQRLIMHPTSIRLILLNSNLRLKSTGREGH